MIYKEKINYQHQNPDDQKSLFEKQKLLLFLRMSVRDNSLKNRALITKVKKEIAREMTNLRKQVKK